MSLIGKRVEVDGPATGPGTGSGRRGVAVAVRECSSSVTGAQLRWTEVDVRLDSGKLITREPRQLRVVEVPAIDDTAHGYTFAEWLSAAGRSDSASGHDLRAAWRAGEDPSEYEVARGENHI